MNAGFAELMSRMPPEQRAVAEARYRASQIPGLEEFAALTAGARTRLEAIGPFEQALELDKSWHILHYVFTGTILPSDTPADSLLTGEDIGEDVGYGPARLHDTKETQEFAEFLDAGDIQRLQERVNFQEMSRLGVYSIPFGSGTDAECEDMLRSEIANYFPLLRAYVVSIAAKEGGLLIWLS